MEDSDTEAKIYGALALMHSMEKNSVEKLRMMLDSLIAKKFGPEQTLTSRMPRNFLRKVETCQQIPEIFFKTDTSSDEMQQFLSEAMMDEMSIKSMKIYTTESEDSIDRDDVPRISIPDEGSGEGALCLVCNGSKLGPFILLECQNCEDVYHPLCHQPPVIEIDVYDPQLIWFCGRCSKNSNQKKLNLRTYSDKERIEGKSLTGSRRNRSQNRRRKIDDT